MKFAMFAMAAMAASVPSRSLVDMAGRTVSVKPPVSRVYSTSPVGEIFMYTLAPDRVAGVCWTLRRREIPWLLPSYARLPVLGGWFGKSSSANLEEIVRVAPGAILTVGTLDPATRASAEAIQGKTGIPVVVLDGSFESTASSYRLLGTLVGRQARSDTLASWAQSVVDGTRSRAASRRGARPRIYYAEGLAGLETDPGGSSHTELIDWVGGENVAKVPLRKGFGRSPVSFEQLLAWDPDWILVGEDHTDSSGEGTWTRLKADPKWRLLRAVREKRIVRIPDKPFNWFDRPPAPSRLLGALWLESVLYPSEMPRRRFLERTREFFRLFYHRDLSPKDEAELFHGAWPG